MRLGVGWKGGWRGVLAVDLREEAPADRELSLLRERLEDSEASGTLSGDMASACLLSAALKLRPPRILTLALRAIFCSRNVGFVVAASGAAGLGRGEARRFESGMVKALYEYVGGYVGVRWRAELPRGVIGLIRELFTHLHSLKFRTASLLRECLAVCGLRSIANCPTVQL